MGFCRLSQRYQSPGVITVHPGAALKTSAWDLSAYRRATEEISYREESMTFPGGLELGVRGAYHGHFKATLLYEESYQKVCTCIVAIVDREIQSPGVEVLHVIGSGASRYQCSVIRAYTSDILTVLRL